jgi:hypothetical protein
MDCLDRTNVVQSVFARNILHKQLYQLKILGAPSDDPFAPFPEPLEAVFREFWVNNANAMSILYSGTDALKKDFTKYGKRTYRGLLDDGWNSAVRYVLNNFYDGTRQDTYDIFLGHIDPFKNEVKKNPGLKLPLGILFTILFVAYFGAELLVGDGWLYWITFTTALFLAYKVRKPMSNFLVNRPTLNK